MALRSICARTSALSRGIHHGGGGGARHAQKALDSRVDSLSAFRRLHRSGHGRSIFDNPSEAAAVLQRPRQLAFAKFYSSDTSRSFNPVDQASKQLNFPSYSQVSDCPDESESIFGGPRFNTVVVFVPQMQIWIVERFGKFSRILVAGLNFIVPIADRIASTISLKEIAKRIPSQPVITADNVMLDIDGVLYFKVNDPYKACYGVKNPDYAIEQIAMTTMRSEIGKITLDNLFRERENLNTQIVASLSIAVDPWGVQIMRYEIRDIRLPSGVQRAMVMIVEAERKKRAAILESQGRKQAEINIAEGQRAARILSSEADKQEEINRAHGDAAAVIARAEAHAKSLEILASKLSSQTGINAAALQVAENYVKAFRKLAKESNTMIIPNNPDDVSAAVVKALTIYKTFTKESDDVTLASQSTFGLPPKKGSSE